MDIFFVYVEAEISDRIRESDSSLADGQRCRWILKFWRIEKQCFSFVFRPKDWTLRNSKIKLNWVRLNVVYGDDLLTVWKLWLKPVENRTRNTKVILKTVEKNMIVSHSNDSKCQWMFVRISSEPQNILFPNLVWWCSIISQCVLWKIGYYN